MRASASLPNRLALDSSVLIAYFLGEKLGRIVKEQVLGNTLAETFVSHLTLAETFYILCRSKGEEFASKTMTTLENTGYLKMQESSGLDHIAARYKCSRKISLADCYVLALARNIQGAALFARREIDIEKEAKRSVFDIPILFLEDIG